MSLLDMLPFKPGDSLWGLDEDNGYRIEEYPGDIEAVIVYTDNKFRILAKGGIILEPGGMLSCTSREQAETLRNELISRAYNEEFLSSFEAIEAQSSTDL